jgi:hypothetical protein
MYPRPRLHHRWDHLPLSFLVREAHDLPSSPVVRLLSAGLHLHQHAGLLVVWDKTVDLPFPPRVHRASSASTPCGSGPTTPCSASSRPRVAMARWPTRPTDRLVLLAHGPMARDSPGLDVWAIGGAGLGPFGQAKRLALFEGLAMRDGGVAAKSGQGIGALGGSISSRAETVFWALRQGHR